MVIIFGTAFLGKVKTLNNQCIETKFFCFFVPLFPINSMLVTSSGWNNRQGIEIPLNSISVISVYARLVSFIVAISNWIFYYSSTSMYYQDTSLPWSALIFSALCIYFCFFFGKSTKLENEQRNKMGKAIGIYAMPNWFYYDKIKSMLDDLNIKYKILFESDWKSDLMKNEIPENKLPILYALAVFNLMFYDEPEDIVYYNRAYEIFS